ncbi:MAG: DUF342 domain-containing protein, partial [Bdellovibrionales bacterium]|nr:DUF342 domain-containing protein [Bdellovibrionales bacterium]
MAKNVPEKPNREYCRVELQSVSLVGTVPDDKMKFFLQLQKPTSDDIQADETEKASQLDIDKINQALSPYIDTSLVNLEVLSDLLREYLEKGETKPRRLIKGEPASDGTNGKIVYLVKRYTGDKEVTINKSGGVEFANLHLFDNIEKGQVVARIYAPKEGRDGFNAVKEVLKAKQGAPAQYKIDKSLKLQVYDEKGYDELIAERDGYIGEESGVLTVVEEFSIRDDIDFHYGNINFIGRVSISGDVFPGFSISAIKGIEIRGSVKGGSLISKSGPISVSGFVFGGPNSRVISGESFSAGVVQEVNADIRGDISISKEARDSILRAQGYVRMSSGICFGGQVRTVCGGEFRDLGSEGNTRTEVNLCADVEATTEYGELLSQIENHKKILTLLGAHLGPYKDTPARIQLLKGEFKKKMEEFRGKYDKVLSSQEHLENKRQALLATSHGQDIVQINVLKNLNPGVVFLGGDQEFAPTEKITGPISIEFSREKNTI